MVLDTQKRKQVTYFTGTEIENTCMKGEHTLFVVGVRPVEEIDMLAKKITMPNTFTLEQVKVLLLKQKRKLINGQ